MNQNGAAIKNHLSGKNSLASKSFRLDYFFFLLPSFVQCTGPTNRSGSNSAIESRSIEFCISHDWWRLVDFPQLRSTELCVIITQPILKVMTSKVAQIKAQSELYIVIFKKNTENGDVIENIFSRLLKKISIHQALVNKYCQV